jgi:hypothetical protein
MSDTNGTKIFHTREYTKFKLIKGNRPIDEKHVQALMKSMRNKDLLIPIAVSSKMEVLDGQHRLEARRRLKFDVPYYWTGDLDLSDVQAINASQKGWTNKDFCKSYIALGKKDYEVYQWFTETYKLPHVESVNLLTGGLENGQTVKSIFQSGDFKVKDLSGAKKIAEMLSEISPLFPHWTQRNFVRAIVALLKKKHFDWKVFMKKVEMNPTLMQVCMTTEQYIDLIEKVYNYKAQNKVSLKYGD